jgi:hypothetical protein
VSEPVQSDTSRKKRGWCFCAGCILLPFLSLLCLVGAYFIVPPLANWLGIFGDDAREVYQYAPDPVASRSLTESFEELDIPGVKVYVIPIKDQPTQGAFIILDSSAGYAGLDPLNPGGEDEVFLQVIKDITRRNRDENLRLAHITVEYRDEYGERATSFTVDQEVVEQFADGLITQKGFFAQIEIDLVGTLEYLGIEGMLEETGQ